MEKGRSYHREDPWRRNSVSFGLHTEIFSVWLPCREGKSRWQATMTDVQFAPFCSVFSLCWFFLSLLRGRLDFHRSLRWGALAHFPNRGLSSWETGGKLQFHLPRDRNRLSTHPDIFDSQRLWRSVRLLDSFLSTSYLGDRTGPKYWTPGHNHQFVVTPNEIVDLYCRDCQLNDPPPILFLVFPWY